MSEDDTVRSWTRRVSVYWGHTRVTMP